MLSKVVSVTHQFKVLALLRCSGCTEVVPEMQEAVAQVVHHFYTRFEKTHKFILDVSPVSNTNTPVVYDSLRVV